jgi:uridylate kinase
MVLEQKTWLNHALFSGMASFIKRVADRGEIEIMICGGGSLKRTWDDLNKVNQVRQVRTPGSLASGDASQCANSVSAPQASS